MNNHRLPPQRTASNRTNKSSLMNGERMSELSTEHRKVQYIES